MERRNFSHTLITLNIIGVGFFFFLFSFYAWTRLEEEQGECQLIGMRVQVK